MWDEKQEARNKMTLDEAIKHSEEVAEEYETQADKWEEEGGERWGKTLSCRECAREHKQLAEWLKELKQFKEQEHCEDAVSRKTVLNTLNRMDSVLDEDRTVETYKELLIACYNDLPPVTPTKCIATVKFSKEDMQELVNEKMKDIVVERKKGKWINKSLKSGCGITFAISKCTCCGKNTFFDCDELLYRYCPNCGAEMEGGVCKGCHYNDGEVHAECVVCDKAESE